MAWPGCLLCQAELVLQCMHAPEPTATPDSCWAHRHLTTAACRVGCGCGACKLGAR